MQIHLGEIHKGHNIVSHAFKLSNGNRPRFGWRARPLIRGDVQQGPRKSAICEIRDFEQPHRRHPKRPRVPRIATRANRIRSTPCRGADRVPCWPPASPATTARWSSAPSRGSDRNARNIHPRTQPPSPSGTGDRASLWLHRAPTRRHGIETPAGTTPSATPSRQAYLVVEYWSFDIEQFPRRRPVDCVMSSASPPGCWCDNRL